METQASLVGSDGVVELDAVACVHLHLATVVGPHHLEGEDAVGLDDSLGDFVSLELRVLIVNLLDGGQHFAHGLQVFTFGRILALKRSNQIVNVHNVCFRLNVFLVCFPKIRKISHIVPF